MFLITTSAAATPLKPKLVEKYSLFLYIGYIFIVITVLVLRFARASYIFIQQRTGSPPTLYPVVVVSSLVAFTFSTL